MSSVPDPRAAARACLLSELVPDSHVLTILGCLPPNGFIRQYIEYAYQQCVSPAAYHLGSALALVSTCSNYGIHVDRGAGIIHANLYTMFIGDAGSAQKSTAIKMAKGVLAAIPEREAASPGSYEGLLDELQENPQKIVIESEFSRFLTQARSGNHLEPLKDGYTDLYDCPDKASKRTSGRVVSAQSPYLVLLAAIAPPLLEDRLSPTDFTGGFFSRWLILYAERTRKILKDGSVGREDERKRLQTMLMRISTLCPPAQAHFIGQAAEWEYAWRAEMADAIQPEIEDRDPDLASLYSRSITLFHKIAMLLAVDEYIAGLPANAQPPSPVRDPNAPPLYLPVTLDHVAWAAFIVALHLRAAKKLYDSLAPSPQWRLRRTVCQLLEGGPLELSTLMTRTKTMRQPMLVLLESMETETVILRVMEGTTMRYALRPKQAAPAAPAPFNPTATAATGQNNANTTTAWTAGAAGAAKEGTPAGGPAQGAQRVQAARFADEPPAFGEED